MRAACFTCLPVGAHEEDAQHPARSAHPHFDVEDAVVEHQDGGFGEEVHGPDDEARREELLHVVDVDFGDGRVPRVLGEPAQSARHDGVLERQTIRY